MKANQLYDKLVEGVTADDIYYKCNDAEQILFEIKSLLEGQDDLIKQLEGIIIELNDVRMTAYNRLGGNENENI